MQTLSEEKPRIGISACLLGQKVRYDGQHKRDEYLVQSLGKYVEYVPVCPEVECGLPVPRESMHLEGTPDSPRLITTRTKRDLTEQMRSWCELRVGQLAGENLSGFIFKKGSPSSGMERVTIYTANGMPAYKGAGLFAKSFMESFPLIPVEDEGRLHDPELRENFIERVFSLQRWRRVCESGGVGDLVEFHSRHKLLIMAHSPQYYRQMGQLVANAGKRKRSSLFSEYQALLMTALGRNATVGRHANVLQHILGYFKKDLSEGEKLEALELIENYRLGYIPLIVPITLLNHYVRFSDHEYLKDQLYLKPHPLELQLRNHV